MEAAPPVKKASSTKVAKPEMQFRQFLLFAFSVFVFSFYVHILARYHNTLRGVSQFVVGIDEVACVSIDIDGTESRSAEITVALNDTKQKAMYTVRNETHTLLSVNAFEFNFALTDFNYEGALTLFVEDADNQTVNVAYYVYDGLDPPRPPETPVLSSCSPNISLPDGTQKKLGMPDIIGYKGGSWRAFILEFLWFMVEVFLYFHLVAIVFYAWRIFYDFIRGKKIQWTLVYYTPPLTKMDDPPKPAEADQNGAVAEQNSLLENNQPKQNPGE